ncbi:hypothetical protein ABT364_14840 [Massilia sp. SR12]
MTYRFLFGEKILRVQKFGLLLLQVFCLASPISPTFAASPELDLRPQVKLAVKAALSDDVQKTPNAALAKLDEAGGLPDLTEQESFVLARARVSVLAEAREYTSLVHALQLILASPLVPEHEKASYESALVAAFSGAGQYAQLVERMSANILAGSDPQMYSALVGALYKTGDFKTAAEVQLKFLKSPFGATDAQQWEQWAMLAGSCKRADERGCYIDALERMVSLKYSQVVLLETLNRISQDQRGDRVQVEVYRLKQKVAPLAAVELLDFGRLLLRDGAASEAHTLIESAFKTGKLGKGEDAPRQERLRAIVARDYAEARSRPPMTDQYKSTRPITLVADAAHDLVQAGQSGKGIEMLEYAIGSGELRDIGAARLHLALAYSGIGRQQDALAQLGSIPAEDSLAPIGRLWSAYLLRPTPPGRPGSP